jgi:hypothetical protein
LLDCIRGHDLQIVILSSWRFQVDLRDLLQEFPRELAVLVVGTTGEAKEGEYARLQEIEEYVARHHIRDWRALDDASFEFPRDHPNLICCDGRCGIHAGDLRALEAWLSAKL